MASPRLSAAGAPPLGCRIRTTGQGAPFASSVRSSKDPSVEPSSTTINSIAEWVCANTEPIASRKKAAWLYAGTTTETSDPCAGAELAGANCRIWRAGSRVYSVSSMSASRPAPNGTAGGKSRVGRRSALRTAARYPRPERRSGSRWHPSPHSFQALTKISRLPIGNRLRVCSIIACNQYSNRSGDDRMNTVLSCCRRAVLSHPGITQRNVA